MTKKKPPGTTLPMTFILEWPDGVKALVCGPQVLAYGYEGEIPKTTQLSRQQISQAMRHGAWGTKGGAK